jgi:enoyl-CoA hydratase/carnithine racemase
MSPRVQRTARHGDHDDTRLRERLSAHEARELGLVTDVARDAGELTAAVAGCLELLCSKPPQVHRDIKRLMRLYAAASAGVVPVAGVAVTTSHAARPERRL